MADGPPGSLGSRSRRRATRPFSPARSGTSRRCTGRSIGSQRRAELRRLLRREQVGPRGDDGQPHLRGRWRRRPTARYQCRGGIWCSARAYRSHFPDLCCRSSPHSAARQTDGSVSSIGWRVPGTARMFAHCSPGADCLSAWPPRHSPADVRVDSGCHPRPALQAGAHRTASSVPSFVPSSGPEPTGSGRSPP
jgi:hypothetical protein